MKISLGLAGLAALMLLAGCVQPPPEPAFSSIRYDQSANYRLDVARVMVVQHYRPPGRAPNVDHAAPIPPIEAMRAWIGQRFIAVGANATLRVSIIDAAITETPLETDQNIEARLTTEREATMAARAEVLLEVVDLSGRVRAETEASVTRSRTLAEGATQTDRDQLLYQLTRDLMHDLDTTIAPGVQRYLAAYLR